MEKPGDIFIKHLSVTPQKGLQGKVEAGIENRSGRETPPAVLLLYFYDSAGRIRDRVSVRLNSMRPAGSAEISSVFRLKNNGFFTYSATISH